MGEGNAFTFFVSSPGGGGRELPWYPDPSHPSQHQDRVTTPPHPTPANRQDHDIVPNNLCPTSHQERGPSPARSRSGYPPGQDQYRVSPTPPLILPKPGPAQRQNICHKTMGRILTQRGEPHHVAVVTVQALN